MGCEIAHICEPADPTRKLDYFAGEGFVALSTALKVGLLGHAAGGAICRFTGRNSPILLGREKPARE